MMGEVFQIGGALVTAGLLLRLRAFLLSFELAKTRKSDQCFED